MLIKCSACKFLRLLHILEFLLLINYGKRKSLHDVIIISWMAKRARERFMSHFIIFSWRAPMLRIDIGHAAKKTLFKPQRAMNISWRKEVEKAMRKTENSPFSC